MGIVSRFGKWLDARFPEKLTTDEVRRMNQNLQAKIENTSTEFNESFIGLVKKLGDAEKSYGCLIDRIRSLEEKISEDGKILAMHESDLSSLKSDMNHAKIQIKMRTMRAGEQTNGAVIKTS